MDSDPQFDVGPQLPPGLERTGASSLPPLSYGHILTTLAESNEVLTMEDPVQPVACPQVASFSSVPRQRRHGFGARRWLGIFMNGSWALYGSHTYCHCFFVPPPINSFRKIASHLPNITPDPESNLRTSPFLWPLHLLGNSVETTKGS